MKNIVLIGMMGSGKSTVAKHLSLYLKLPYIDTDELIQKRANKSIAEIFEFYGENYFRTLEEDIIMEVSNYKGYIIATGGGIILNNDNVELLRRNGNIIYLKNEVDELIRRLYQSNAKRPLISDKNLHNEITKILDQREQLYINSADWVINNKEMKSTINEIMKLNIFNKDE